MNKSIKTKLNNVLKSEAEYTMRSDYDLSDKVEMIDTIKNIKMIIDNYDELEPVLKEFFEDKAYKEKWHITRRDDGDER